MKNVMENIAQNLRKAFPKMPIEVFENQTEVLTLAYLEKCRKYFDFEKMYPVDDSRMISIRASRSPVTGNS